MLIKYAFLLSLLLISLPAISQRVSPYQPGSYYPGLESTRDLAAVEPGFYFINYSYWLKTQGYYDRNGERFRGGILDFLGAEINLESPEITAFVDVPFFFYAFPKEILGAHYLVSIAPVYLSSKQSVFLTANDTATNISSEISGFGDLSFMPFGLSWSDGATFDISFMYTIYAPTGRFSLGADDNLGQGFWTHQLQTPFYYYLNEKATALFLMPTLELNGKLKEGDFNAGNRLSLEYGISQYFTEWLEIELINGHNWQIQDDRGSSKWWSNTRFDGRDSKNVFSIGASVWPIKNTLSIRLRYIQDYGVKQRFQNRFWSVSLLFAHPQRSKKVNPTKL